MQARAGGSPIGINRSADDGLSPSLEDYPCLLNSRWQRGAALTSYGQACVKSSSRRRKISKRLSAEVMTLTETEGRHTSPISHP